jgi:hypothetical protein
LATTPEGTAGQAKVRGIDLHHRDKRRGAALAQRPGALRMEFNRDDDGAGREQWPSECARPGADVEDQVTGVDPGAGDERVRVVVSELMPSPVRPPSGGHDAP